MSKFIQLYLNHSLSRFSMSRATMSVFTIDTRSKAARHSRERRWWRWAAPAGDAWARGTCCARTHTPRRWRGVSRPSPAPPWKKSFKLIGLALCSTKEFGAKKNGLGLEKVSCHKFKHIKEWRCGRYGKVCKVASKNMLSVILSIKLNTWLLCSVENRKFLLKHNLKAWTVLNHWNHFLCKHFWYIEIDV